MPSPDMINELIFPSKSPGSLILAACHRAMVLPGSVLVFEHVALKIVAALYCHRADRAVSAAIINGCDISRIYASSRRAIRVAD